MPPTLRRTLHSSLPRGLNFPCEEKCEECLGVVALDDKIASLRKAIAELEAERSTLLSKVNDRHDTISNRLPTELLVRILELSLPMPDTIGDGTSRLEIFGPLVFSAVSRHWRDLVCSAPSLWALVPVYRRTSIPDVMNELMAAWIHRSRQCLLSIVVKITDTYPRHQNSQFIFRIINRYSHRLAYLNVEAPFSMIQQLDFGDSSVRTLSTLSLKPSGFYIMHQNSTTRLNIGQELRPVTLMLRDIPWTQLHLHADRLTHVELAGLPIDDCTDLLAHAPMIASLSICATRFPRNAKTKPLISCQNLRYLQITSFPYYISNMLDSLIVPFLQHLELVVSFDNEEGGCQHLFDSVVYCLRRSSAQLEILRVQQLILQPELAVASSLKNLIHCVAPSIKHLDLDVDNVSLMAWQEQRDEAPWQQLVDCIFDEQAPLSLLQSITLDGVPELWLRYLKAILASASRLMSAQSVRPMTLIMPFDQTPLNDDKRKNITPDIYRNGTLPLSAAEIEEMLSIATESGIAIKMPLTARGLERDDIFPDVLEILTRLSLEK